LEKSMWLRVEDGVEVKLLANYGQADPDKGWYGMVVRYDERKSPWYVIISRDTGLTEEIVRFRHTRFVVEAFARLADVFTGIDIISLDSLYVRYARNPENGRLQIQDLLQTFVGSPEWSSPFWNPTHFTEGREFLQWAILRGDTSKPVLEYAKKYLARIKRQGVTMQFLRTYIPLANVYNPTFARLIEDALS
jgi:hypothetical protein